MPEPLRLDLVRFEERLGCLRDEVAALSPGRPPAIIVVTKYLSAEDTRRLRAAGIAPLAENRAAELAEKTGSDDREAWHFVGHLQRNKIATVLPRVGLLHALDSRRLAAALEAWLEKGEKGWCTCLVQVNNSGEASKGGLAPADAEREIPLWVAEFPRVRIRGLMTMAPPIAAERCRPCFAGLRELRDRIRPRLPPEAAAGFVELSMGMSNDYRVAVAEGATLLRIGTRLYED